MSINQYILGAGLLAAFLTGCAGKPADNRLPVNIMSAGKQHATRLEVLPVKQVVRPMDVLDIIFHIGTTTAGTYKIQPGDQVEVSFMTAPELSGGRVVLPDGTVELPYVGTVRLAGLSAAEARAMVTERYKNTLKKPEIMVSVTQPMGQQGNLRSTLSHPSTGMSREVLVGRDGRASFPLIGTVSLRAMTIDEVNAEINKRYAQMQSNVSADVLLKSTEANQVFVLGEVVQPGAYPVTRPVSVYEALSMARGSRPAAKLDSVIIVRRKGDQAVTYEYDMRQPKKRRKSLEMAYLQPDDMLYIPETRLSKAGRTSRQLADVILFQGVGFGFAYRVDNKDSD